jgi:hypothetical protein
MNMPTPPAPIPGTTASVAASESDFTAEGAPPPGRVGSEAPAHESTAPCDQTANPAHDPAHDPDSGTAIAPVRRSARVCTPVEVRQGDGSIYLVPCGPCTVQITALDATISWVDGDTHGLAAMPLTDFDRHLADRSIEFVDAAPD